MGIKVYDHVRVTGLSNSGTVDNLGTWNEDVNIGSFVSVPAGATGVIISYENDQGNNRWYGLRTPGKTAAVWFSDSTSQAAATTFVPLGPGNTIDIYVEDSANQYIRILGVTDSRWQYVDADNPVAITGMTSVFATKTITSAPNGTIGVLLDSPSANGWRETGLSGSISGGIGMAVGKLNGSKQIDLKESTSGNISILAYISGGVSFNSSYPPSSSQTLTADGTWRTSTIVHAGKTAVLLKKNSLSEDTINQAYRANGSSYAPVSATRTCWYEWHIAPLNASGEFQYRWESGAVDTLVYDFTQFDDFAGTGFSITSVTPANIDDGESGITITGTGFGANQGSSLLRVGGVTQTVTQWTDTAIVFTAVRSAQSMGDATLQVIKV